MIDRYKKKGGFIQLLNLMETCGSQKQEKFLKIIEEEDQAWAEAVKTKMISIKKIFSWDDNTIAEIAGSLNDMTISISLFGLDAEVKEKMLKTLNRSRRRKIEDEIKDRKPEVAEISTAFVHIITHVRKMVSDGFLMLEKIDPQLVVNSEFEDKLLNSHSHSNSTVKASTVDVASIHDTKDAADLRKKLFELKSENDALREKLHQVESRLAQIRKIA
jgi:hypothetical protein